MNYEKRLNTIRRDLEERGVAALLVTEPKNRRYLSGFDGSSGWLLVTPEAHYILTDGRYWDQVERQAPEARLVRYTPAEHKTLTGALAATLKALVSGPLGVEIDSIPLVTYREVVQRLEEDGRGYLEVEGLVGSLRECKDEQEVDRLERAAAIADLALERALADFRPGLSELQLKASIEYHILMAGGESTSFPTIVASGPNGSYPHARASERIVREGELVTVDFGAVYQGYCSDMTRTIWYGKLPEREVEILNHTRRAHELAVRAVAPGVKASDLDGVARDYLEQAGLGQYFVHSLGHGVGLDIHEQPGLRKTNDTPLKVGHVVTIEPGVYLPGQTGCRVEDTVVVVEGGCRRLNGFPKQPPESTGPSCGRTAPLG